MSGRWLISLLCSIAISVGAKGQLASQHGGSHIKNTGYTVKMRHLSVKNGLPTDVINFGLQGRDGFIWIATREGLVRYDGENFVTYTNESHGLSSNNILRIAQIDDDWLWLVCGVHSFDNNRGGYINLFNVRTYEVVQLADRYPEIQGNTFNHIRTYNDTALIIYENRQLCFYAFTPNLGIKPLNICAESFDNFLIDATGLTWSAQGETGSVLLRAFTITGELIENITLNIREQSKFNLIGFTQSGRPIGWYTSAAGKTHVIYIDHDGNLNPLDYTAEDQSFSYSYQFKDEGEILFRDYQQGIFRLKPGLLPEHIIDAERSTMLPNGDWRFEMFKDSTGKYWVAHATGLYVLSIKKDRFTKYLVQKEDEPLHQIRGIYKAANRNLYVASQENGLVSIDEQGIVSDIDKGDYLLTYGDETRVYFGDARLHVYDLNLNPILETEKLKIHGLWTIYYDQSEKEWWLGGEAGILRCKNLEGPYKDYFNLVYAHNPVHSTTYQIFKAEGKYWFVSSSGLYAFDDQKKEAMRITASTNEGLSDLLADVHAVLQDGPIWWIATNGKGLVKWDRVNNVFTNWRTKDGLSSDVLYACLPDNQGYLWISSNFGIMRFDKKNARINTYTEEDGLPHHEFNRISWHKDFEGNIYFGGLDGFVGFNPQEFVAKTDDYQAKLQVTSFFQFNEKKKFFEDLTTKIQSEKAIVVYPYSGFFTLNFNLLDFEEEKKQYAYMLKGYDEDWKFLSGNSLQMGNLPYGVYKLMIKGQNHEGQWSKSMLELEVRVLKPFYLKLWFIILAIMFVAAAVVGIVFWRTWKLNQDRKRLVKTVHEQTRQLRNSLEEISKERDRSEKLLLNILPVEIASELKEKGKADARNYEQVSIIFTDFKEFTQISEKMNAIELVDEINHCFEGFDAICEKHQVEKIKTIGDAYMAVAGLPKLTSQTAKTAVMAAFEMLEFIESRKIERECNGEVAFEMRIGIHSGPVVAGIVGSKKFQYDIWGDTVNTASRIEAMGDVGRVNISQTTYELIKKDPEFRFEKREKVAVKGKGEMQMWFVYKV